jgi:hypothetical protein
MTSLFIVVPLLLIIAGILCLIFQRPIGIAFCRLGKGIWKVSTFGFTDMRWFYPEDKAPGIFRIFGIALVLFGMVLLTIGILSFSGPGTLYAMREARGHLENVYGIHGGEWSVSASKQDPDAMVVSVSYRYGSESGRLRGEWDGEKYVFTKDDGGPTNRRSQ